jgi:CRP-like cAMP-binding protein/rhodanese-related sulfurtransferase
MSTTISFLALNNYQPLDTLTPENLKEIADKLTVLELKQGDYLFKEGDRDDDHVFLYKGSINLVRADKTLQTIEAGSAEAKTAIAHIIPRNINCVATSDVVAFKVDADMLDLMLAWDQTGSFQVNDLNGNNNDGDDWMTKILQTEAFHRIPAANIQAIFSSLEDIVVKVGQRVITQDEAGDYFYIIKTGRCMVSRKIPGSNNEVKLAELNAGSTFGEEALISDATRNASIVMLSNGTLSRLSKENFLKLLNEPMIKKVDYTSANLKVNNGEAEWLDVRLPAEFDSAHIKGATHLPLIFLRMKIEELDPMKAYILYCDTERRSSSASYILSERGFNTSVLINGTKDVPHDDLEGSNV